LQFLLITSVVILQQGSPQISRNKAKQNRWEFLTKPSMVSDMTNFSLQFPAMLLLNVSLLATSNILRDYNLQELGLPLPPEL
jgi:hypothetical protein